jgi:hypothetical protein
MAGVRFDQNQIKPGVSKCRASATIVKVMETIAEGDILVATGYDVDSGIVEVSLATATDRAKSVGMLYVADYAVTVTGTAYVTTAVALEWKRISAATYSTSVLNTSDAAIGDAVYLSATGGKLFTIGSYPAATASGATHSAILPVGRVLRSHATEGVIMLAPSTMSRSGLIVGKVTLSGSTPSTVIGLGAELDGAAVLLTADGSTAATTFSGVIQSGTLTIAHPTSSDDCTYMIIG